MTSECRGVTLMPQWWFLQGHTLTLLAQTLPSNNKIQCRRPLSQLWRQRKPVLSLSTPTGISLHLSLYTGANTAHFKLTNIRNISPISRKKPRLELQLSFIWTDPQCHYSSLACQPKKTASLLRSTTETMNFSTLKKRLSPCLMSWLKKHFSKLKWKCWRSMS